MSGYAACPHCRVKYPLEQLYSDAHDRPALGKHYTVVCAVCSRQFEVEFRRRWPLPMQTVVK